MTKERKPTKAGRIPPDLDGTDNEEEIKPPAIGRISTDLDETDDSKEEEELVGFNKDDPTGNWSGSRSVHKMDEADAARDEIILNSPGFGPAFIDPPSPSDAITDKLGTVSVEAEFEDEEGLEIRDEEDVRGEFDLPHPSERDTAVPVEREKTPVAPTSRPPDTPTIAPPGWGVTPAPTGPRAETPEVPEDGPTPAPAETRMKTAPIDTRDTVITDPTTPQPSDRVGRQPLHIVPPPIKASPHAIPHRPDAEASERKNKMEHQVLPANPTIDMAKKFTPYLQRSWVKWTLFFVISATGWMAFAWMAYSRQVTVNSYNLQWNAHIEKFHSQNPNPQSE